MLFVCADFGVAVFRATVSGCSEPHSASEMRAAACRLSPLPDRNGRKLHLNRAERHTGRSVSWGRYIPMGSANLSPLISRLRDSFPPRGSLLQESFRTTQQGDEREQYCPPSSVAYGDSPPKGKPFYKISFALHDKATDEGESQRQTTTQNNICHICHVYHVRHVRTVQGRLPLGGSCRVSD